MKDSSSMRVSMWLKCFEHCFIHATSLVAMAHAKGGLSKGEPQRRGASKLNPKMATTCNSNSKAIAATIVVVKVGWHKTNKHLMAISHMMAQIDTRLAF